MKLEITITLKRNRADRGRQIEHDFPHAWKQIRLESKRTTGWKGEETARRAGRERKHCGGKPGLSYSQHELIFIVKNKSAVNSGGAGPPSSVSCVFYIFK